ncbi:transmembrane channel-like protein 7 [Eurytemora carolleeae]|uniref:transmembrane channel-like protein 7 n=1 Tax=Eurytemora carolleeae TaxID=1294199 RepID=UPI000C7819C2|nr:transmembrane channel-like protein 7 [Eurytemora carolleeae]|eukprot:XP_023343389.1 transmembrane channel-like protein 7 [Eurytemora affinis]
MNFIPKVFGQDFNDFTRSLATFSLGKRTLRKIQGKFGMAVYNYFKFLKWACTLNLVMAVFIFGVLTVSSYIVEEVPLLKNCNESTYIDVNDTSFYYPEYSDQCCSSNYLNQTKQGQLFNTTSASAFFSSLQIFLQDLFQGSGWMVDSYFYYGKYAPDNKSERFQMDLAYWFIILSCFLLSLISTVWSSANSFEQSFKWNKFNKVQYFDLSFCNWDFCLDTIQAVHVKQDVLKNEARTALETDRMQALQDDRTRGIA